MTEQLISKIKLPNRSQTVYLDVPLVNKIQTAANKYTKGNFSKLVALVMDEAMDAKGGWKP